MLTRGSVRAVILPSLVVAGLSLCGGCATIQSGSVGVPLDAANRPKAQAGRPEIQVSAGEAADLASPYFGLVEVTFENNTAVWKEIDQVRLDFTTPEKNRSIQIPWGQDIDLWENAILGRNRVRAINHQSVMGALATIGALGRVTAGQQNSPVAVAGGALTVAAVGALYASSAQQTFAAAGGPPTFSGSHLLNMPIRIPPGLFTKRWILFYTAARPLGGCIDSMILSYETSDQAQNRILLPFKAWSEWQNASCYGGDSGPPPPGSYNNR